ncbi:MAG TPA: hypothetical protein VG818_12825 [Gemmatimonadaceae bacterium]|jgi:hypothetical protein|nr:hypothetical protein [Gemmatimonadaceae bacterium]
MSRLALRSLLLAAAFAIATWAFGWWAVPLLGLAWGAVAFDSRFAGATAAWGAGLGWLGLLAWEAARGAPIVSFGGRLAAAMQLPLAALWIAEVLFPVLVAWSAATLAAALRSRRSPVADGRG